MYTCIYVYMYIRMCIYICIYTCTDVYVYIYIYVSVYICIYLYRTICICICICLYIDIYMYRSPGASLNLSTPLCLGASSRHPKDCTHDNLKRKPLEALSAQIWNPITPNKSREKSLESAL